MAGRIHDVHPNNKKTIKEPGMPTLTTRWATLLMCFAVTLLTGCKSAIVGEPSYSLAQGCYSLKASQDGRYIVTAGHDLYALSPVGATEAEKFFAKPSGLGTFLLYDREGGFLANDFISVKRHWKASKKAEWKINDLAIFRGKKQLDQQHTLVSTTDELRLLVGKTGLIVQANPPPVQADVAGFVLEKQPDEQCKAFPELTVDAEVDPAFHEPKDPTAPVRGYADLHAHLGFPKAMAGLAMAGDTFSPGVSKTHWPIARCCMAGTAHSICWKVRTPVRARQGMPLKAIPIFRIGHRREPIPIRRLTTPGYNERGSVASGWSLPT